MTVRKVMLATSTYVFPLVAMPLLAWAWLRIAREDWRLVTLVLGVPVIFGYVTVIVAARIVKRWSMTGRWQIGGAYVHHGFIYASKLAFALLLATRDPMAVRSWTDLISIAILVGAATAFGGWWHDGHAIREGKIVFRDLDGRAAEETLASFAPPTYFAVGATYAIVTIAGWQVVAAQPESFPWVFMVALAALCVVPSIVLFALDSAARRSLRSLLFILCIATPLSAQQVLEIYRDPVKPGREAQYRQAEDDAARICVELRCPHPYIGIESLTGPHEVWFLNLFESDADIKKVTEEYAKKTELMAALNQITARKKGLVVEPVNIFAKRIAGNLPIRGARFFIVSSSGDGAIFEAPDGSRFVFSAARTLPNAKKKHGRIFAIRPWWSLPAAEWIEADREFWSSRSGR